MTERRVAAAAVEDVAESADDFAKHWWEWFRAAEAALIEPHGFLAMTGLTSLGSEPVSVPGVPGRWWVDDGVVVVDLPPGRQLRVGSDAATGEALAGRSVVPVTEREAGPRVWHGRVLVEVVHRPEGVFVRPRDPDNPRRTQFAGTRSFEPDLQWRLRGVWIPPAGDRTVSLPSALDGVTNHYGDAGTVRLEVGGRTYDLALIRPVQVPARLVFRDATSGQSTYPSGRYIDLELPDEPDATLVVDFNRARNFPCSYSPQPTCPAAPPENVLDVAVMAGARYVKENRP